jgi:hypothetical protein
MGSFLSSTRPTTACSRAPLGDYGYRTVLSRALDRSRYYVEKDRGGHERRVYVPLSQLDPMTRSAYDRAQQIIDRLDVDAPVSPIDWMRMRLAKEGYRVAEITGRHFTVDYTDPKRPKLSECPRRSAPTRWAPRAASTAATRRRPARGAALDAIILNVSGSTGISLHASEKFADQRPRQMIVAQAAQDINVLMQMLGRPTARGRWCCLATSSSTRRCRRSSGRWR